MARIAARKMKALHVAITFGNRIFLHNTRKEDFLKDTKWLRHELKHIEQYRKMGFFPFIYKYLILSLKHGYYLNPLEIEARLAETDDEIINRHDILV